MHISIDGTYSRRTSVPLGTIACMDAPLAHETLLQALTKQHRQGLQRYVQNKIGHPADAQDVVQQAFLEATRSLKGFKGDSEVSTWLYGIAKNLIRNYLARAPHRRFDFVNDAILLDMAGAPTPAELAQQGQQLRILSLELSALPRHMREALLLVTVDEMSYEAAALKLRIPLGTVRSRVSRARKMLRERMPHAWGLSPH